MCSGKSRVGRTLAQSMGLRHVDIDRVVEARVGPLVPYFEAHGEQAFREQERTALLELLDEQDVVVSTGGGTPTVGDNLTRMLVAGPVVFLDVSMEVLIPRIVRSGGRSGMGSGEGWRAVAGPGGASALGASGRLKL